MCRHSRGRIFRFNGKTHRCFCCFTAAMLVPLGRAPTWRFHTKLYKFGWSTFPNNARMKYRTELNLGKVFYVWLISHIQDSWLNSLNGYDIYFWLRDTANQPFSFPLCLPPNRVMMADTASVLSYRTFPCCPISRTVVVISSQLGYPLGWFRDFLLFLGFPCLR